MSHPKRNPGGTHKTPAGAVVWIPQRPTEWSRGRNLAAVVTSAAALIGMIIWWPADGPAVQTEAAQTEAVQTEAVQTEAVQTEAVQVTPADTAVPRRRPAYEGITDDTQRRAAIRNEIARCSDLAAACSVDDVLRMGSELVQIRERTSQSRTH